MKLVYWQYYTGAKMTELNYNMLYMHICRNAYIVPINMINGMCLYSTCSSRLMTCHIDSNNIQKLILNSHLQIRLFDAIDVVSMWSCYTQLCISLPLSMMIWWYLMLYLTRIICVQIGYEIGNNSETNVTQNDCLILRFHAVFWNRRKSSARISEHQSIDME